MKRFKYLSAVLFAAIFAGLVVACNDDDKNPAEEAGKEAGKAMCDCVASKTAPDLPQHPASPLPPEGFNPQNPDLTDTETLAYLADPGIVAYLAALEEYYAAFGDYTLELTECLGGIVPYQQYIGFELEGYDPEAAQPLYSVFNFKDQDFEKGFKDGSNVCYEQFSELLEMLMGMMGGRGQ